MNTNTIRLGVHRIASLALFCFSLSGCAAAVACETADTSTHVADAGAICRDTMGLTPSNVPFDSCVQSLMQNLTALKQPTLPEEPIAAVALPLAALPESDTQKSCLRFGLALGSADLQTCADNLDASLFEAADAGAR